MSGGRAGVNARRRGCARVTGPGSEPSGQDFEDVADFAGFLDSERESVR